MFFIRLLFQGKVFYCFFADVLSVCNRCKSLISIWLILSGRAVNLTHTVLEEQLSLFLWVFCEALGAIAIVVELSLYHLQISMEKKIAVLLKCWLRKRLIMQMWKIEAVPKYDVWLGEMARMFYLERFYNEDRDCTGLCPVYVLHHVV